MRLRLVNRQPPSDDIGCGNHLWPENRFFRSCVVRLANGRGHPLRWGSQQARSRESDGRKGGENREGRGQGAKSGSASVKP